jgi:hypothetical protein
LFPEQVLAHELPHRTPHVRGSGKNLPAIVMQRPAGCVRDSCKLNASSLIR